MRLVRCDDEGLAATAAALNGGGVAVVPTDTVYGLAARPDFPDAVARLFSIKGRDGAKPIALLASGADAVSRFGYELAGEAARLAAAHWPGALSLVVGPDGAAECFRVPDHEWTRRLAASCGGLLRVTSANASGMSPATDAAGALLGVGRSADVVADGGVSPGGVPSTVARVFPDGSVKVLREGAVALPEGERE